MIDHAELVRIYLDPLPKGTYHRRDDFPGELFVDGHRVASVNSGDSKIDAGLLAAMVLVLNNVKAS